MMKSISHFTCMGKEYEIWEDAKGVFHVYCDGVCVQPNHDAQGVIRYLSNMVFNADFMRGK